MSLVKHRLQLSLQLPVPEVKISNFIPFIYLHKSITTASQEVSNLLDFEKLCVLGHGNYGTVYKVRHRQTSAIYALKVIRGDPDASQQPYQPSHEMKIMISTDSPFIIKCLGAYESLAGEKAIVMEYMDAGTLSTLLKANGPFSESSIAHIAYQVLSGLNYLHAFNIFHLDIKPSNLLVDKNMNVKIGDFGVSKIMRESDPPEYWDIYVGTFAYMSPERLDSNMYDSRFVSAADIWSLGVTLLELYVGHFPFLPPGEKPNWMQLVLITRYGEAPSLPKEASEELRSFFSCCLHKEPNKRWTALQLLSHPFICGKGKLED
ncbi:mitogen-activated protein kinase kinase 9-like [Herrania umbratica]|uniref:mitogen-activated protein kinase kinase n=1 Tax=Herrania umbratica TaxID=108875 RepID=A0A6J1B4F9_9ROSI|nr:mitogen-activated protein kinase kinase 9-like [Herrania umbratica]